MSEFYKPCHCAHPTKQQPIKCIETAIMAFFAQHPQFANGATIDFEKLELSDSTFKKEYDSLLTLDGFSMKDMSEFHIVHMYADTIQEVLLSTQQIINSLIVQPDNNVIKKTSISF